MTAADVTTGHWQNLERSGLQHHAQVAAARMLAPPAGYRKEREFEKTRHWNRKPSSVQLGDEPKPGTWRRTTPSAAMDRATSRGLQGAAAMQLQSSHFPATQKSKNPVEMTHPAGKSKGFGPPEDCPNVAKQGAHLTWLAPQYAAQVDSMVGKDVYGPQEQPEYAHHASTLVNDRKGQAKEKPPTFESSMRNVRSFVARVRRKGPQFARNVSEAFRNSPAQSKDGAIQYNEFRRLAFQVGLTHRENEAETVFEYFMKGTTQLLYVDEMLKALHPELPPKRLAIVQQAWRALDPEGKGVIDISELVDQMNPAGNLHVKSGFKTVQDFRRELLEYFGASNETVFSCSEFALEETANGRRKAPIGSLTIPVHTPAGRPSMAQGAVRRSVGDVKAEIASHPAREIHDIEITPSDFEAYYASVSMLIPDDDDFEAELRAVWSITEPGGLPPDASHHPFVVEVDDGSRILMKLRDNKDLESCAGAAGFHTGVYWGMGPEVAAEVKRRLEKQSGRKIVKFTWA